MWTRGLRGDSGYAPFARARRIAFHSLSGVAGISICLMPRVPPYSLGELFGLQAIDGAVVSGVGFGLPLIV